MQAALRIIEDEGYESFSVEKVARAMGVKSPSLYHHFANRSDLLTDAARALLANVPLDDEPPIEQWQDWFVALSMQTYRLITRHPRAAGLLFSYFPTTSILPAHERGAHILAEVGVPAADRWIVMRGLEKLVFGMGFADADDMVAGREQLPRGIEAQQWPYLVEAVEAGETDRVALVERAIRLYMAGVEAALVTGAKAVTGAAKEH